MIRGVYVSPDSVVRTPDYAAALTGDAGVNLFVLRAGFDPERTDPALAAAAEVVRRCGAKVCALVGTWWGHGVESSGADMRTVCPWPDRGAAESHERQWAMRAPGGAFDERIAAALRRVIVDAALDAVCLTHARFRHAADIAGLFEAPADGWGVVDVEELHEALCRADAGARVLTSDSALARSRESDLPRYLDELASGGDVFVRWFRARREIVSRSIRRFGAVACEAGGPSLEFGQNAMNPFMADLCGQDYRTMTGACDFVQPLLGYMRWHVMEPVLAWRDWFRSRVAGRGGREALTVAKRLLGLGAVDWPEDDPERLHGEGPASLIRQTTHAALRRVMAWQSESLAVTPVLQGQDWPPDLTHEMSEYAESIGVAGVVYQGCKNLLPLSPPDDGWR